MTWIARLVGVTGTLVAAGFEIVAIATEALRFVAEHLDSLVDDLQEKVAKPKV